MNINQDMNICSFIPHRPPMLFIDALNKASEEEIEAEYEITSDCIFLRSDNSIEAVAYIEILAQCFAAGSGFLNQDKSAKWGYLAAMRGMKVHGKAFLGDTVKAVVRPIAVFGGIIVVEGELFCKDKMIASAQLKIYIPESTGPEE